MGDVTDHYAVRLDVSDKVNGDDRLSWLDNGCHQESDGNREVHNGI